MEGVVELAGTVGLFEPELESGVGGGWDGGGPDEVNDVGVCTGVSEVVVAGEGELVIPISGIPAGFTDALGDGPAKFWAFTPAVADGFPPDMSILVLLIEVVLMKGDPLGFIEPAEVLLCNGGDGLVNPVTDADESLLVLGEPNKIGCGPRGSIFPAIG